MTTGLRILHLYPDELGINGDVGNVMALTARTLWRGVECSTFTHSPGDTLPDHVDLVHIGSGPASGQAAVRADLESIAPTLRAWKTVGVPFLAISAGWQMLGQQLTSADGTVTSGVGIFPTTASLTGPRSVGEIVIETELGRVTGFENHGAVTMLLDGATPLGSVVRREAANGATSEGVVDGSSIGTNLHGPFLPMNPAWADRLLESAMRHAGIDARLDDPRFAIADGAAEKSRAAIAKRLGLG